MMKELFTVISNLTTSWLVLQNILGILFISLISVSPSVIRTVKVNIFPTKTAKILLELLGMLPLPLIKVKNNRDAMIWNVLATFCCTYWKDRFHGRAYLEEARTKSTTLSRRKRLKLLLTTYVEVIQANSRNTWNTADLLNLKKLPISRRLLGSLKAAWIATTLTLAYMTTLGNKIGLQKTRKLWKTA